MSAQEQTPIQKTKKLNADRVTHARELVATHISGAKHHELWDLLAELEVETEPLARLIARAERLATHAEVHAAETARQLAKAREDKLTAGERETIARQFSAEEKEYLAELRGLAMALELKISIVRQRIAGTEIKVTRTQGRDE